MPRSRVTVLEGMPGGGKTSLANLFRARGWRVVPEYLEWTDAWPATEDDDAHQHNWVAKEALFDTAVHEPIMVDRNFLTSLAYAYSVRQTEPRLLEDRIAWCCRYLRAGAFQHPSLYCLLDCTIELNLQRRGKDKPADHPWAKSEVLTKLGDFYAQMPEGLAALHPDLALGEHTQVLRLSGADPLLVNLARLEQVHRD